MGILRLVYFRLSFWAGEPGDLKTRQHFMSSSYTFLDNLCLSGNSEGGDDEDDKDDDDDDDDVK